MITKLQVLDLTERLGYFFTENDAQEVIKTSSEGESVEDAVFDFLCAYEGGCIEARFSKLDKSNLSYY